MGAEDEDAGAAEAEGDAARLLLDGLGDREVALLLAAASAAAGLRARLDMVARAWRCHTKTFRRADLLNA